MIVHTFIPHQRSNDKFSIVKGKNYFIGLAQGYSYFFAYLVKVEEDPGDVTEEEDDDDAEEDDRLTVVLVQLLRVCGRSGGAHHLKQMTSQIFSFISTLSLSICE